MSSGGRIPDAAMIHAARKRRQLAREMGSDYIAVESNSSVKKWVLRDTFKEGK
jgi:GC-rich sequence DNA-binding factor